MSGDTQSGGASTQDWLKGDIRIGLFIPGSIEIGEVSQPGTGSGKSDSEEALRNVSRSDERRHGEAAV